jgi:hypothetical protein
VDDLEATTKELARAEPPLPVDAQATIIDDLNEIRYAARGGAGPAPPPAEDDPTREIEDRS